MEIIISRVLHDLYYLQSFINKYKHFNSIYILLIQLIFQSLSHSLAIYKI